jgi:hypothetical protein
VPIGTPKISLEQAAEQRAVIAARLETLKHGQRADRTRDANLHVLKREDAADLLNESQRAVIAARLANMQLGDNQHQKVGVSIDTPSISLEQAAELLNVGRAIIAAKPANMTENRPKTGPIGTVIIPTAQETT